MIAYTNPTEQLNKINLNFPKRIFPRVELIVAQN